MNIKIKERFSKMSNGFYLCRATITITPFGTFVGEGGGNKERARWYARRGAIRGLAKALEKKVQGMP